MAHAVTARDALGHLEPAAGACSCCLPLGAAAGADAVCSWVRLDASTWMPAPGCLPLGRMRLDAAAGACGWVRVRGQMRLGAAGCGCGCRWDGCGWWRLPPVSMPWVHPRSADRAFGRSGRTGVRGDPHTPGAAADRELAHTRQRERYRCGGRGWR